MSSNNLGLYKDIVTCSKKVGGPAQLLGLVGLCGYAVIRGGEALIKTIYRHIKNQDNNSEQAKVITITKQGEEDHGLVLEPGDKIRIIQEIEDGILLIEKIGDKDNPYVVSSDLLCTLSDSP